MSPKTLIKGLSDSLPLTTKLPDISVTPVSEVANVACVEEVTWLTWAAFIVSTCKVFKFLILKTLPVEALISYVSVSLS